MFRNLPSCRRWRRFPVRLFAQENESTPEFGGAVVEIVFERASVELGEIGHERIRSIPLQPAKLGVERAISATLASCQSTPVRLPQGSRPFR